MRTVSPPKRLVADRFRRVWAIVEYVASHPGCTRRTLADHFAVAERTLQADLNTIRYDMGLPLARRDGYRFLDDDVPQARAFGLPEAYLLARALQRAASEGPGDPARSARWPPGSGPVSRAPAAIARLVFAGTGGRRGRADPRGLCYRFGAGHAPRRRRAAALWRRCAISFAVDPVVDPEMVVPYQGGWYLIGQCRQTRTVRMYALDTVVQASLVAPQRR